MHSKVHNNDRTTVHSVIFPLQDPSKPFLPNLYFCTEPWLQRTLPASDGLIRLHDSDSFSCRHPSPGQTTVVLRIWAFASHSLCGHRVCKPVFRVRCGNESATVAAGETYTVLPCRCGNSEQRGKDTVWTVHEYDDKVTNPKQKKKKENGKILFRPFPVAQKSPPFAEFSFSFPHRAADATIRESRVALTIAAFPESRKVSQYCFQGVSCVKEEPVLLYWSCEPSNSVIIWFGIGHSLRCLWE